MIIFKRQMLNGENDYSVFYFQMDACNDSVVTRRIFLYIVQILKYETYSDSYRMKVM